MKPALYINGTPVYSDPNAVQKTHKPNRVHVRRARMRVSYHLRIQKKWIKRFGYVVKPAIFRAPFGFIMHPSIVATLSLYVKDMISYGPN